MAPDTATRWALLLTGLLLVASGAGRPQRAAREATTPVRGSGEEPALAFHELYESGRIQFSAPPPTIVATGVQCDSSGNIYLAYGASFQATYVAVRSGASLPVSKVSLDSKSVVQFPAAQLQGYAESHRSSFYVDPRGKVYGLEVAYRHERGYQGPDWPESLVVKYKDDGTVDSVVKLEPPTGERFEAWKFAALLDGNFLVTGTDLSDEHTPTRPLTGIFDRGGAFVAPLRLPHDLRPSSPKPPAPAAKSIPSPQAGSAAGARREREGRGTARPWLLDLQQGLMAGSLDGNVYLLRASIPARLYVISTAGSVLREVEVKPPEPGMIPIQMSVAGQNDLLLEFSAVQSPEHPETRVVLALLDLSRGKLTDTYRLPPNAGGLPACATPQNEFLFLGTTKDNQLEVVKFVAR